MSNLLQLSSAERDPHSGGHANGWCAADHHVLDRPGYAAIVTIRPINFLSGQQTLVKHHHRPILPLDSEKTAHAPTCGAKSCTPVAGFQAATVWSSGRRLRIISSSSSAEVNKCKARPF